MSRTRVPLVPLPNVPRINEKEKSTDQVSHQDETGLAGGADSGARQASTSTRLQRKASTQIGDRAQQAMEGCSPWFPPD